MGAVEKPLVPEERRPTSDHTKTGLKEATDTDALKHSLNAYREIAEYLMPGYYMAVMDVDAAFPILPLAPVLWPFFLFLWEEVGVPGCVGGLAGVFYLFLHLFADFGAAGVPGTFKIFFSDVVVGIARSERVLTLPMPVHVDDMGIIGSRAQGVDRERERFSVFARTQLGVAMKEL